MKRRILSSLMALVLVFGLLPATAFAEGETPDAEPEVTAVGAPPAEEGETPAAKTIYVDAMNGDDTQEGVGTAADKAYKTLETAVTAAKSGDTIQLGEGNYTLYKVSSEGHTKGKDLTFVGQGVDKTGWNIGALVPDPANFGTEYNGDYSFDGAGTITFQNMTLRSGSANYLGFIRADQTVVEDCIINGKTFYWGYTSATFTNTTFNCPDGDYALWTYSSPTMTFDKCTFNSSGKVINVYTDYSAGKYDITVNFEDCTVTGSSVKQVLNVNDSNMGDFKYVLNISGNNTVSGVPCDKTTCSRLYGFGGKAGNNTGRLDVSIDGTPVWAESKMLTHKYSAGEHDNAFSEKWGAWTAGQDGKLHRTGKRVCDYCGYSEDITDEKDFELDVSRSKTATKLDKKTWTSDVTLSLPSAEEKLASDVVFVLDKSSCSKETAASAAQMLTDLQSQVQSSDSKIRIGVVVFGGDAKVSYPLKAFPATEDALKELNTALSTRPNGLMGGSNMHAGLLAAQEMLKSSTTDNNRKYVILVSDGLTRLFTGSDGKTKDIYYQYSYLDQTGDKQIGTEDGQISPKDCVYFGMIDEWTSVRTKETKTALRPIPYSSWSTYFSKVKDWVRTDGDTYALDYETYGNDPTTKVKNTGTGEITDPAFKYISHNDYENHAMSVDRAVYEAYNSFTGMVDSGYHCYAVLPGSGTPFGTAFMGAMNEYANNNNIDFTSIGNEILYAVGAGSKVEDKMGAAFDFVPGSLKLTVGGKALAAKPDGNVTYFGDAADALGENNYRFKVTYDPTADAFEWTINENVSNFAPVQLTYTVKLTKHETAPGTYGTEDLKGENQNIPDEKALYTNESAVLNAKNSVGVPVAEQVFPKPSVSYTISSGTGGDDGDDDDDYFFAIQKVDAQDGHALNGATFELYQYNSKGKPVNRTTAKTSRNGPESGIALFSVDNKNSYEGVWYYAEVTAPEGYVLDSTEHKIKATNFSDSRSTAVQNAVTVRNYRGTTPDLLNDSNHFAYVIGYKDGNVRPYGLISRAETTTIFFRLLKDSVRDGNLLTSNTYTDVPDDYWANTAISTMTGLGIVQGRSTTTFDPKAPITRAQFAAICARFDTGKSSGEQTFSDIQGHWAEKYIQRAAELGWIKGFEDGTFRPDTYITRAQAMTMINRVLNRIPEDESDLLPGMNVWPDCNPGDWFYLAVQEATNSHDFEHKAGNYETWTGMNKDPDWTRYEH